MLLRFVRFLCVPAGMLSAVLALYGTVKLAQAETAGPAIDVEIPGAKVVRVETDERQLTRDRASAVLGAAALIFVGSVTVFGVTTWKLRGRTIPM